MCFITNTGGREAFLGDRIAFRPATVVDTAGVPVGHVEAVELVTVGQRRGLGLPGGGPKRYVVDVDVDRRTVVVGDDADQFDTEVELGALTWAADPVCQSEALAVRVQCSAHGATRSGRLIGDRVVWDEPQRRVAPGQSVVLYDLTDTRVLAGAVATRPVRPSAHR